LNLRWTTSGCGEIVTTVCARAAVELWFPRSPRGRTR